jgi:hypothetical protein
MVLLLAPVAWYWTPVEDAEVSVKFLLGKLARQTNSERKAFFDMALINDKVHMNQMA